MTVRPNSEGSQTPKSDTFSLDRRSERSDSESPKLSEDEPTVLIPNSLDFTFPPLTVGGNGLNKIHIIYVYFLLTKWTQ